MIRTTISSCVIALFLFSCSSHQVVSEHAIQKRKYRPGLFVSKKAKKSDQLLLASIEGENDVKLNNEVQTPDLTEESSRKNIQNQTLKLEHIPKPKSPDKEKREVPVSLEKSKEILAKFIPMRTARAFYEKTSRLSKKTVSQDKTSIDGIIGFILGLLAIGCLIGAIFIGTYVSGYATIFAPLIFAILAICFTIFGLIISINGLKSSSKEEPVLKAFSIGGIVLNGLTALAFFAAIVGVVYFFFVLGGIGT